MGARGRISVVMPTLDEAEHVEDAVSSVLAQTCPPVELVAVDGGSRDGTRDVLRGIEDPRLTVIEAARGGVSAARNRGIAATDAELVAFMDADDVWHEAKLERQIEALDDERAGLAYTGLTKATGEPRTRSGASGDVEAAVRQMQVPTYTSTLLVRRALLDRVGGFDGRLPCFEDWDLCLRLAGQTRFAFVDEPLVAKGASGSNISAEPDRLREAVHRLEAKHELPDATRARLWTDVGRTHAEAGRLAEARAHLQRSLTHRWIQPKAWLAWLSAASGSPRLYEAVMEAVHRAERRRAGV